MKILHTICPGSSDPFYIVTYYIKWVITSWTHSINNLNIYEFVTEIGPVTFKIISKIVIYYTARKIMRINQFPKTKGQFQHK